MLFNKSIKKFILLSLLVALPAQTMAMSWPFSGMKKSVRQLFSGMKKTFKKHKTTAAIAIGGCVATCLSAFCFKNNKIKAAVAIGGSVTNCLGALYCKNQKLKAEQKEREAREAEEARRIAEREDEEARVKEEREVKIEEEARMVEEASRRREEANRVAESRCLICFLDEDETEEILLQEVRCLSGNIHPAKIHQSCLEQALANRGRCPICRFSNPPRQYNWQEYGELIAAGNAAIERAIVEIIEAQERALNEAREVAERAEANREAQEIANQVAAIDSAVAEREEREARERAERE